MGCDRFEVSASICGAFPCESRQDDPGPDPRGLAPRAISAMRPAISDAPRHAGVVCVRPFRRDGVRAADLSGGPARHRGVPGLKTALALPLRHPRRSEALQSGLRQRASGLAAVRGLDGGLDAAGTPPLSGLSGAARVGRRSVRFGRDRDRVEPQVVSLGTLETRPSLGKAQHPAGPERRDPDFRELARGEAARSGLA